MYRPVVVIILVLIMSGLCYFLICQLYSTVNFKLFAAHCKLFV